MCWRIFVWLVIASVARASLTLPIVNGPQYRKLVPRIVGLDTIDVGERGWPELVDLGKFAVCRRNWLTDTVTRLPNADGDGDLDWKLSRELHDASPSCNVLPTQSLAQPSNKSIAA